MPQALMPPNMMPMQLPQIPLMYGMPAMQFMQPYMVPYQPPHQMYVVQPEIWHPIRRS